MSGSPPPPYSPEKAGPPAPAAGYPQPTAAYPQQPSAAYPMQPSAAGYPQQPHAPPTGQTTVMVAQPIVVSGATLGVSPASTVCPHCRAQVITAVDYEIGGMAWLLCLVLCLVGCWLGCCFIPFCIESCKDAIHTCPNCKQHLGTNKRL